MHIDRWSMTLQIAKTTSAQSLDSEQIKPSSEMLRLVEESRRWTLYSDEDFLVINKPEGIAVQGGPGLEVSVDKIYKYVARENKWPGEPKLVHRLDRLTTGALLLAKSSNAASWLCKAFHDTSADKSDGFSISKTYIAVVDARRLTRTRGRVKSFGDFGGSKIFYETYFETMCRTEVIAVLKMKPKTGRKHQLRMQCAHDLQAPILGDSLYPPSGEQCEADTFKLNSVLGKGSLRHLYLHSREVVVKRPGKRPVRVVAPFPDYIDKLIQFIQSTHVRSG